MSLDPQSSDLDQIKSLLAKSFDAEPGEDVPPLPESLRDRITGQYGRSPSATGAKAEGFFGSLTRWLSPPILAGAAAVILLALVAVPILKQPATPSTFRGDASQVQPATVVLYQVDATTDATILESGYFDEKAIQRIQSPEELTAIAAPKIVIDGSTGTILLYSTKNADPTTTNLPTDSSQLPDIIAELLRGL